MIRFILTLFFFVTITQTAWAQSDSSEFLIRVFGGTDDQAPTTPTLLTATPVGPTQIDITWSTSTDNFFVSGYTLFRGSTTIATTTLTTYSDTGLSASTTYYYSVRAFDPSFNYSSTSNIISTTTPDYPPPPATTTPTTTPSYESTSARVVLDSLNIVADKNSVQMVLETARPSQIEVRWGRSASYEMGYVFREVISRKNSITINELEPGTVYEYQIIGYTPFGAKTILKTGQFSTKDEISVQAIPNVSWFRAESTGLDVNLSWINPRFEDFSYVRLVRSHLGFPRYPQDGAIVYQGSGQSFVDKNIFTQFSPVYYTAFVYDKNGNISSGAVALSYSLSTTLLNGETDKNSVPGVVSSGDLKDEPSSVIFDNRLSDGMKMPELNEIIIQQDRQKFSMLDRNIILDKDDNFIVSISADFITGNLKSIIFTVVSPTDTRDRRSYLLKINNDQSAYVAVIPAIEVVGNSWALLDVYDYQAEIVSSYQTPIYFDEIKKPVVFPDVIFENVGLLILTISFLVLFILVVLLAIWLRTEDKA